MSQGTYASYLSSTDGGGGGGGFTPADLTAAGVDGIAVTGGTDAVNGSGTSIAQHVADSTHNGYLSSADWITFNSKQSALTIGDLTDAGTDGIVVTGGTGAVIGSGTSIAQHVADSTHNGYLSSADWVTFNAKQSALTIGDLTAAGTDGITVTSGTGAVIGSGTSVQQQVADATHNGYLSSTDWSAFNSKQAAGNYITALTGDVTASGPGSVAATIANNVITNVMVNSGAAIDYSKLAALTSAHILVGSAGNVATDVAMSGDISISNTGATAYAGTVPLNKGGTGQTTKAAAFDALSPMTTAGDLILGGASGTGDRLAIGSNTYVLTSNGTTAAWAANAAASNVTQSTAGLVASAGQLLGTNTNDNASAGNVGEYVSSTFSAQSLNRGSVNNITSISLTAGDWDASGVITVGLNGATLTEVAAGITSSSASFPAGNTGDSVKGLPPTAAADVSLTVPCVRFSLSGTTTVYFVTSSSGSAGNGSGSGRLSARRVR